MITHDLSWEDYLDIDAVNPSRLVRGLKSMLAFHEYSNREEDTLPARHLLLGQVTHCLVLEPERYHQRYAIFDGIRRGKNWEDWGYANPGMTAIKPELHEQAQGIAQAVWSSPPAREVLEATEHEVTVTCDDVGQPVKGRMDMLGPAVLADMKLTTNIQPEVFGRQCVRLHMLERLACYWRWVSLSASLCPDVYVIAVEMEPPHDVTRIPIHTILLEQAWGRIERVLRKIPQCEESGIWPGVGAETELCIPQWAMAEEEVLEWGE